MKQSPQIRNKIARLAAGARPRVLDLFAGCGGLSLGFKTAGFELAAAVEIDPETAASHGRNFHPGDPRHAMARDITALTPDELAADLELGPAASAIDVLIGGPPCQTFPRGRSCAKSMLIRRLSSTTRAGGSISNICAMSKRSSRSRS